MANRRNNIRRYTLDPGKRLVPLSYGLDSEEDYKFTETNHLEVPKYLWRLLLMDALMICYFRFYLYKVGIWLLLLTSVIAISGLIICPSKLHSYPQVEVQGNEKPQHIISESHLNKDENKIPAQLIDEEGFQDKMQIKEVNKEVHLKVLDLCKEGDESNFLTSEITMLNAIKYKRKCSGDSTAKEDTVSDNKMDVQQICISNDPNPFPYDDFFHKITNLEEQIQQITSVMLDLRFKEPGQCKLSSEENELRKIVRDEIIKRENENLGLADFALENSGGSIISTPKTITYSTKSMILLFGFPLWFVGSSPSNVIQASINPGDCWAFHGSFGNIRIRLAAPIIISSFSLYHIPKKQSLTGKIESAPRKFSVVGIEDAFQAEILLGNFQYSDSGPPLQSFAAQKVSHLPLSTVELRIHSNYGNKEFTCIYRFQVHGKLSDHL